MCVYVCMCVRVTEQAMQCVKALLCSYVYLCKYLCMNVTLHSPLMNDCVFVCVGECVVWVFNNDRLFQKYFVSVPRGSISVHDVCE